MLRGYVTALAFVMLILRPALADRLQLNLSEIDRPLREIAVHAQSYPPRFGSPKERDEQSARLKELIDLLNRAANQYPDDPAILSRQAKANAMGHNLDFPLCAEVAIKSYKRLLRLDPTNGWEHFHYGAFLSGTTLFPSSIEPLRKAIELGVSDAHYTLAFVYLKGKDTDRALKEFKEYQALHPGDEAVEKMIHQIESGDLRIKIKEVPGPRTGSTEIRD